MLEELKALAVEAKEGGWCVAFGEFGLDYDRLGEPLIFFLYFILLRIFFVLVKMSARSLQMEIFKFEIWQKVRPKGI